MEDKEKEEDVVLEIDEEFADEAGIKDKFKKLRHQLAECRREKEEYLAGWQRSKADFINARKEEEENRKNFKKLAEKNILLELLRMVDSFEMALRHGAGDDLKAVYGQFSDILKTHGVESMEARGQKFNPEFHEAVESVEAKDKEKDGLVLEELQKGFLLDGEILRPAKVRVGKLKEE